MELTKHTFLFFARMGTLSTAPLVKYRVVLKITNKIRKLALKPPGSSNAGRGLSILHFLVPSQLKCLDAWVSTLPTATEAVSAEHEKRKGFYAL